MPLRGAARRAHRGPARSASRTCGRTDASPSTARDRAEVPAALRGQLVVDRARRTTGKLLVGDRRADPGRARRRLRRRDRRRTLGPTFAGGRPTPGASGRRPRGAWRCSSSTRRPATPQTVADAPRRRAPASGRCAGDRAWTGKYYRYQVKAWQPATQQVVTASVTDPYSVALAADSTHSQLVDLADPALAPAGWRDAAQAGAPRRAEAQIQELSVRDFSIADTTVPAERRGTYLAFTDPTAAGHEAPAGAGRRRASPTCTCCRRSTSRRSPSGGPTRPQPACDLAALPPDSDAAAGVRRRRSPTTTATTGATTRCTTPSPEGGYAVDPDGAARTTEFRQMVAGLNGAGLRVVMDVVYNHTSAAGHRPEVGARPDRARLLPPAARRRHRRHLDLLRQHRARARHDGQAGRRLGRHLGQGSTRWTASAST